MKLDGMSAKDLRELRERIDITIAKKQQEARQLLRERMRVMAAEAGLTIADVMGKPGKRKLDRKALRDPASGVIWSGGGRYPKGFNRNRAVPV